ncbi:MAG: membrane dipeptidase [Chlamydiota bacterium]|nr:membrane dipeptidase [Chlamydiota bacterium]
MIYPIADLHCDLLCYLSGHEKRSPLDLDVRCSIPQLQEGNVLFQILAVYTPTERGSVNSGKSQIESFKKMLTNFRNEVTIFPGEKQKINLGMAIENASSVFSEDESLHEGFARIRRIEKEVCKLAYISFTWNSENRFGGGAHSNLGITNDGKALLEFVDGRNIAIDLSHASDQLAFDILNEIDKNNRVIPVIASHSNARAITNVPRNLPDELIREIISRNGLIGFNFVRQFLEVEGRAGFAEHLNHFLKMGAVNNLCFGADFFYGMDVPVAHQKPSDALFFPEFANSSVYPKVVEIWKNELNLDSSLLNQICSENLLRFMENEIYQIKGSASTNY